MSNSLLPILLLAVAVIFLIQTVVSDDAEDMKVYCNEKNETIDFSFTLVFSCHINVTKPESLKKNVDCFNKVNPNGVAFPNNTMDIAEVKKFICQKDFEQMGKKAEECAKISKEEMEEEEKKMVECLKNYTSNPS